MIRRCRIGCRHRRRTHTYGAAERAGAPLDEVRSAPHQAVRALVDPLGEPDVLRAMKGPSVKRIEIAGSLRRCCEMIF